MLFAPAGVGLLVLLAVHNLKSLCSVFEKIEASSWEKKIVSFTLDLTIFFLIYIIFKRPLNLSFRIRSLQGWEGLERNNGIH